MTVLAWALRIGVDFSFMLIVVPILLFIVFVPISISGHGVREAALVYFLAKAGVPAAAAFSFSVLSYLVYIATILSIALLLSSTGSKTSEPQISERGRDIAGRRPAGRHLRLMKSKIGL